MSNKLKGVLIFVVMFEVIFVLSMFFAFFREAPSFWAETFLIFGMFVGVVLIIMVFGNLFPSSVLEKKKPTTKFVVDDEGNIRFTVKSRGLTREQWSEILLSGTDEDEARLVWPRSALLSTSEAPTNGVEYNVIVCPGNRFNGDPPTEQVRVYAEARDWKTPHWEVACLVSEVLKGDRIDRVERIVVMHQPVIDQAGQHLLGYNGEVRSDGKNGRVFTSFTHSPDHGWPRWQKYGFAFVL